MEIAELNAAIEVLFGECSMDGVDVGKEGGKDAGS